MSDGAFWLWKEKLYLIQATARHAWNGFPYETMENLTAYEANNQKCVQNLDQWKYFLSRAEVFLSGISL